MNKKNSLMSDSHNYPFDPIKYLSKYWSVCVCVCVQTLHLPLNRLELFLGRIRDLAGKPLSGFKFSWAPRAVRGPQGVHYENKTKPPKSQKGIKRCHNPKRGYRMSRTLCDSSDHQHRPQQGKSQLGSKEQCGREMPQNCQTRWLRGLIKIH